MDFESGSGLTCRAEAVHDGESVHGSELPTRIDAGPLETGGSFVQKRAKPDFLALVLAYFFGQCDSTLVGASAYRHLVTPLSGLELPSFTAVQRRGAGVFNERLAGNYLESFILELADGWASLSAEVLGIGAREVNYDHEVVSAPANATSITLAVSGVAGATAAARLANVYRVRARDVGGQAWQELTVTAVSAAVPAVIDLSEALGTSGDDVDYEVDYLPVEPAWCVLPGSIDESPLKLVEARVLVDGYFDGSTLSGGHDLSARLESFSVSGKNNLELRRFPGSSGPAGHALRGARELTISLTQSLRDTVLLYQADHPETERLAVALILAGAEIEPGSGARFGVELIFPCCGIIQAPVTVAGRRLAQAGDLVVMDDGTYGGVAVRAYNQQVGYL
jgi:hypothetical protein